MTKKIDARREADAATFVIDAGYLRNQARDAARTFFAPLQGVYSAATGLDVVETRKKRNHV